MMAVAGCAAWSGDDEDDTADEPTERSLQPHAGEGWESVPANQTCDSVCGMSIHEDSEWTVQLAHTDDTGAFFCSPGCMAAYVGAPEEVRAREASIRGVWLTDYETGERIDGQTAYYVLQADREKRREPMSINPRPFAEAADADAYATEHELGAEAVITFDEIDADVAAIYRISSGD